MRAVDANAQGDFEEIVRRDVEAIRAALAGLALAEPAFATCLHYSPDSPDLLDPAAVYVGVESDKRRALAARTRLDVFAAVWNPMEYTGGEVMPEPSLRDDPAFVAVEERVVAALHAAGCDEPARFVLNEVARRLTESPPVSLVSGDFVTFVMDQNFDDRLLANLRAVAPPTVAARLRAQGLLRDAIDALTE